MYAYLRVVAGPDQGKIFNLVEGTTLSIGRGEHSDTRLKDTTACWSHDPQSGVPTGVTLNDQGSFILGPGSLKVYQALSSRNGGEAIDSASY